MSCSPAKGRSSSSSITSRRKRFGRSSASCTTTSVQRADASIRSAAPIIASAMMEMHISEIGFCSGHSASGVCVDEFARTTVPGLYAAGDMASVPHNYMLGAFINGAFAGEDAAKFASEVDFADFDQAAVTAEQERVLAPTKREDGIPPSQIEYKTRRMVNDYLQPPKVTRKMEIGTAALRRGARGHPDGYGRARPPRTDARAGSAIDPRLRRDGGRGVAVPHGKPMGSLPQSRRVSRARRRRTGSAIRSCERRRRQAAALQKARSSPTSSQIDEARARRL